jgi:hypothetical protein
VVDKLFRHRVRAEICSDFVVNSMRPAFGPVEGISDDFDCTFFPERISFNVGPARSREGILRRSTQGSTDVLRQAEMGDITVLVADW